MVNKITTPPTTSELIGKVNEIIDDKQDTLVSGTNIKTINNQSILGSGNIDIQGGGGSYTAGTGIDITNDVISVTSPTLTNRANNTSDLTICPNDTYAHPATVNNAAINIGENSQVSSFHSIAIGGSSMASGGNEVVIGYSAFADQSRGIAIGYSARSTATEAIQLGYGTNSETNSLYVGTSTLNNWKMLGSDGLIPDARISSNIARSSDIPTVDQTYDGTSANAQSGVAVASAISGKANTDLSNISGTSTKSIDGQWVYNYQLLANNVAADNTTPVTQYSLANYLPNDGYDYEVLMQGLCNTGTTSGQFMSIVLQTDIYTGSIEICSIRTRSASLVDTRGNGIVAVGAGRYVSHVPSSSNNYNGNYSLAATAYRRIGTNS